MSTISSYYRILEIKEGATLQQIKVAYRRRAKELHPDRNKSTTAHTDFILLTEAYEYLSANPYAKVPSYTYSSQQQWYEERQQQARQRAQSYANMQYDDFVHSEHYPENDAIAVVAHHLYIVFVIVFMLGIFALMIFALGIIGVVVSVIMGAFAIPLAVKLARGNGEVDLKQFSKSVAILARWRWSAVVVLGIITLVVFTKIGLQTLIPFSLLCQLYLLLGLITFLYLENGSKARGAF